MKIFITADFFYGSNLPEKAEVYQKRVAEQVESMTMFDVSRVDLDVRKLIHPEETSEKAEQAHN